MFNRSIAAMAAAMMALGRGADHATTRAEQADAALGFPELLASLPPADSGKVMHRSAGWRQKRRRKLERQTGRRSR